MKISTKGRYGLRVMMDLAEHYGSGPIPVSEIAQRQGISPNYISVLVTTLRAAGLVRTVRGPKGGYELAKHPGTVTALNIVTLLEGRNTPADCVADASSCPRAGTCAARDIWCEIETVVDAVLSDLTLEKLAARQRAKEQGPVTYDI